MIHDIFPSVEIPDNSFYLFLLLLFCTLYICFTLLLFFYKRYEKSRNRQTVLFLKILQQCDFTDAKQSAYKIEYYAKALATTEEQKALLAQMQTLLQPYKYRDGQTPLPQNIQTVLKLFIKNVQEKVS